LTDTRIETPPAPSPARKESLFDEGFLIIIVGLGNVFNFYFHIFMSRNLGPEGYSALNSLLSLLYIVAIPIITIQTTITKFTAQYSATGESARVRRLFLQCLLRVGIAAFVLMSIILVGAPWVGDFFNISANGPIRIAGVLLFFTYLMPVFWAVLQGREQFTFLGFSYFFGFIGKCAFGILFALIGWGVGGVLFGVVLSFILAFVVGFPPIRDILRPTQDDVRVDMKPIYLYVLPVVTALFFLSFFCNLDIALVRHFYGHSEEGLALAGYYATASIVGKAFLFLPHGIILALFPKVARKKATGEDPLPILKRGLLVEFGLSLVGIGICIVLAEFVAMVLGKSAPLPPAPELVSLIRFFGIAITPVAATTILVNYNLANERYAFIWLLLPLTLLTFAGIWVFHSTPMAVLATIAAGGFSLLISISIFTFFPAKAKKKLAKISAAS
jgi:O-antigen/teichoic acid export membrane protein